MERFEAYRQTIIIDGEKYTGYVIPDGDVLNCYLKKDGCIMQYMFGLPVEISIFGMCTGDKETPESAMDTLIANAPDYAHDFDKDDCE